MYQCSKKPFYQCCSGIDSNRQKPIAIANCRYRTNEWWTKVCGKVRELEQKREQREKDLWNSTTTSVKVRQRSEWTVWVSMDIISMVVVVNEMFVILFICFFSVFIFLCSDVAMSVRWHAKQIDKLIWIQPYTIQEADVKTKSWL